MQNRQVHWDEGLFLRPQHFQTADRYWQELIGVSSSLDNAYNWGVFKLEINQEALDNQIVEIVRCQARTKSGTLISFDASTIDRVDMAQKAESDVRFEEYLRENNGLRVYLGVPYLRMSRKNVAPESGDQHARYCSSANSIEDETSGGNPQDVNVKDLNLQILFESDDLSGYETVPVCRLVRSRDIDAKLQVDSTYFPPCLTTAAFGPLQRNMMEGAHDLLKSRGDLLRRQLVDSGASFATQRAGVVEDLLLLQSINEAVGMLNCYSFSDGVHPHEGYAALCQIIGRLSIFSEAKEIGEMPRYNHDDLFGIFSWALRRIKILIDRGEAGYFQRFFKGSGPEISLKPKMTVTLEPEWFGRDWQIILGLHSIDLSTSECLDLLQREWIFKLGAPNQVDFFFERHARGIKLGSVKQLPSVLPVSQKWQFFSFKVDEAWEDAKSSCAISFRFNADQVANLSDLENRQTLEMKVKDATAAMEFAVFAVKDRG
ncbi:MAG: type VI secretion system baseplate subunit TssK [Planctomycetaceae bacterium]|nr:type VI secretion system baseplate subunit TssK [Planctomycetaceae bacterium]